MLKLAAASASAACLPQAFGQADSDAAAAAKAAGAGAAAAPKPASAIVYPPAPTPIPAPAGFGVAAGPFQPTWESLAANYKTPDWYRDAKFGIWAHWGPQCQPEMGDWYGMKMYQYGTPVYNFHVKKYGHPSKFGFKDVINEWKADKWEPAKLIELYKRAGAKFFAAMANHHDNMDMFDSTYQPWNSTKIGPKKDVVGGWMKAAREADLRFAVSCHGDRSWDWMQGAQGSDPAGPLAGVPYDGLTSKADSKGKWWDGLDPQDLYAQYHRRGRYAWNLEPQGDSVPVGKDFIEKFFNRTIDLINKYSPDLVYFDDTVLPIYPSSDIGLRIAAYLYNTNMARNGGVVDVVMTGKGLQNELQRRAITLDVERGVVAGGDPMPWQTDTCIGSWHYERSLFNEHRYKTAKEVVHMLIDIVSKNGQLMLSVPVRGEGTIDEDEVKILEGIGGWMNANGEGIYGTRPWKVYGEGPSTLAANQPGGQFGGARDVRDYAPGDVRFTAKGDVVYAFVMAWPEAGKATIKSLAPGSEHYPREVGLVELLGQPGPLKYERTAGRLTVALPARKPNDIAYGLRITPKKA